jgi:sugar lactone lactonase YvrE
MVQTIAGNGTIGFTSDGNKILNSSIGYPLGFWVFPNGTIILAEQSNYRLRRIESDGTIYTITGTGISGYSGDNGIAFNAKISSPYLITVDLPAGNIYFSDNFNHRIRKISIASGVISTFAGTGIGSYNGDNILATSAMLNLPNGVAISPNGDIFISDTRNQRIRKVSSQTLIISTVAGSGIVGYAGDGGFAINAKLCEPWSITFDSFGCFFISDTCNHRIRKVDVDGIISTIAGNGNAGYTGDGGNFPQFSLRP